MKINKKYSFIVIVLITLIILMSVAFAALKQTLTINYGNVTQNAEVWNVGFVTATVTATSSGTSNVGLSCGTASASGTAVTVNNTTLSKPNDKCVWSFTIKNSGTIDAKIKNINFTKPNEDNTCTLTYGNAFAECGNITYKLTTDSAGATNLKKNTVVTANNGTLVVYLTAFYTGTDINESDVTHTNSTFKITFEQQ